MLYDLECRFDTRQSFYGKAKINEIETKNETKLNLYSYDTLVASITIKNNVKTYKYFGKYSQTTTRHQKEFFKQNGLNDKQIKELFEKDSLTLKED